MCEDVRLIMQENAETEAPFVNLCKNSAQFQELFQQRKQIQKRLYAKPLKLRAFGGVSCFLHGYSPAAKSDICQTDT